MKTVFILVVFFTTHLFAIEQVKTKSSASQENKTLTMDLKQFDSIESNRPKGAIQVSMTCKTSSGVDYKSGDVGYEKCIKDSARNTSVESTNPNKPASDSNIQFSIGK